MAQHDKKRSAPRHDKRNDSRPPMTEERPQSDLIAGRNAVAEALRSGRTIDHLLVARGAQTGSLTVLVAKAKEAGIPIKEVDSRKLNALCLRCSWCVTSWRIRTISARSSARRRLRAHMASSCRSAAASA